MIPNGASNLKCIDNFIFVFATWICAFREKKKIAGGGAVTKSRHCYHSLSHQSAFFSK